jgi:hypothetical protein
MRKARNLLVGTGFLTLATRSARTLYVGQLPGDKSEL